MRFDDIIVKFFDETECLLDIKRNIYSIEAENLETMDVCHVCGTHVKKKSFSKRIIYDYRPSPVTGDYHIYKVNLSSRRYVCTNPKCKCSFTAGLLDRSKSSRSFNKYVVQILLDRDKPSYSFIGRKVSISHTLVSDIVKDYAKDVNLHFSPHNLCHYLFLQEFNYQKKKRYCLVNVNVFNKMKIIGFFGHNDHKQELKEYFEFHLQEKNSHFTIATDDVEQFKEDFSSFLNQITVVASQKVRNDFLNQFECYEDGIYYSPFANELEKVKQCISSFSCIEELSNWWNGIEKNAFGEHIKRRFGTLKEFLLNDPSFCYSYVCYKADFNKYQKKIDFYNGQKIPFEKMSLFLMYKDQGEYLFTDQESEDSSFDTTSNISYRPAPLDDIERAGKEAERILALYENAQDRCDEENNFELFDTVENPFR